MSELVALPMFPLSGVHFPGQDVPLHVFEPRYRALVDDVLAGNQEFGTALISGGCEVGGGDRRTGVGTLLKVQLAAPFEDGRWLLVTRGVERIRIVSWLDDDPYPRALVDLSPSAPADDVGDLLGRAAAAVRRLRMVLSEFEEGPCCSIDLNLGDDPTEASWVLCALAPLTMLDQQQLLEESDPTRRLDHLIELCRLRIADLEAMHHLGGST